MKKNGNIIHMWITLTIGCIFFVIGQILYPVFSEKVWSPLGISLYFLVFAIIFVISMFVLNQARRDYSYWVKNNKKATVKKAYIRGLICVLALLIFSGVFEFLYELGSVKIPEPTSYVFLIDDSASMGGNDPEFKRSDAIAEIMKDESLPYSVYKFTSSSTLLKTVGSYSKRDEYDFVSEGGTDILGSLNSVLDDINNSRAHYGQNPKILLLSDGDSSKFGLSSVVKKCTDNGVVVSTIGFNIESALLQKLLEKPEAYT